MSRIHENHTDLHFCQPAWKTIRSRLDTYQNILTINRVWEHEIFQSNKKIFHEDAWSVRRFLKSIHTAYSPSPPRESSNPIWQDCNLACIWKRVEQRNHSIKPEDLPRGLECPVATKTYTNCVCPNPTGESSNPIWQYWNTFYMRKHTGKSNLPLKQ